MSDDSDSFEIKAKDKNNSSDSFEILDKKGNKKVDDDDEEDEDLMGELLYNPKYEKIGILTNENHVIETDVVIKKENGVKYYNDYKCIAVLGKGSICKVKLVEKNNVKYALKVINKEQLSKKKGFGFSGGITNRNLEGIAKEISILRKVCHRNLVKLYEIMNNKKKMELNIIMTTNV